MPTTPIADMPLTILPLQLPGQVYASPMPFSRFDWRQNAWDEFQVHGVNLVVMLVDDEEAERHAGRDLRALYEKGGMQVIQFPIDDFEAPQAADVKPIVEQVLEAANEGVNVAVHCHAGVGRTGTMAALLARQALGLSGEQAVAWVREHIPGAIESRPQHQLVLEFGE